MPKNGNSAEKAAARRVQETVVPAVRYTTALRLVRAAKTPFVTWTEAADAVIERENR